MHTHIDDSRVHHKSHRECKDDPVSRALRWVLNLNQDKVIISIVIDDCVPRKKS